MFLSLSQLVVERRCSVLRVVILALLTLTLGCTEDAPTPGPSVAFDDGLDSEDSSASRSSEVDTIDSERVRREVRARFDGLVAAARSLEPGPYLEFFDPSTFSALNADGSVVRSLEPFQEGYVTSLESMAGYVALDFPEVHIQVLSPDVAVLVNEFVASVELVNGDVVEARGGGTQVWSKRSGVWLLVHVSSSAGG